MNTEDIVREGKVTAVDNDKLIAKVWFDALGIESDWLPVLINCPVIADHELTVKPWMPKVNDKVLVLYFPVDKGDGVVLGGVNPWR